MYVYECSFVCLLALMCISHCEANDLFRFLFLSFALSVCPYICVSVCVCIVYLLFWIDSSVRSHALTYLHMKLWQLKREKEKKARVRIFISLWRHLTYNLVNIIFDINSHVLQLLVCFLSLSLSFPF